MFSTTPDSVLTVHGVFTAMWVFLVLFFLGCLFVAYVQGVFKGEFAWGRKMMLRFVLLGVMLDLLYKPVMDVTILFFLFYALFAILDIVTSKDWRPVWAKTSERFRSQVESSIIRMNIIMDAHHVINKVDHDDVLRMLLRHAPNNDARFSAMRTIAESKDEVRADRMTPEQFESLVESVENVVSS